jgi:hypothetical protein
MNTCSPLSGARTAALLSIGFCTACGGGDDAESTARVEIVEPTSGATLAGPDVRVVLAAHGVDIVPAGVDQPNSGHHHLFLNQTVTADGETIPAGVGGVVHLGGAQSEHVFQGLAPGEYTLVAQLGDMAHVPVETVVPDTVRFTVSN